MCKLDEEKCRHKKSIFHCSCLRVKKDYVCLTRYNNYTFCVQFNIIIKDDKTDAISVAYDWHIRSCKMAMTYKLTWFTLYISIWSPPTVYSVLTSQITRSFQWRCLDFQWHLMFRFLTAKDHFKTYLHIDQQRWHPSLVLTVWSGNFPSVYKIF